MHSVLANVRSDTRCCLPILDSSRSHVISWWVGGCMGGWVGRLGDVEGDSALWWLPRHLDPLVPSGPRACRSTSNASAIVEVTACFLGTAEIIIHLRVLNKIAKVSPRMLSPITHISRIMRPKPLRSIHHAYNRIWAIEDNLLTLPSKRPTTLTTLKCVAHDQ